MEHIRTLRAVALPALAPRMPDLRRWSLRVAVSGVCLVSALFLTAQRLDITRLHYTLSQLHVARQELSGAVSRLEMEAATLASPKQIERQALRQGFVYPRPDQVVVLDE